MKFLIALTLISLSLTAKDISDTLIEIKQKISSRIKDFPADANRLIRNINGYVNAYKEENIKWEQIGNVMTRLGYNGQYDKILANKKSSYSEFPRFDATNNYQTYTLTFYITYYDRIDDERLNLVFVKGKYSGTLQPIIEKEKLPCYRSWHGENKLICEERYKDTRRSFTKREWYKTQEILKIKFYQLAMDELNKLG
jgi:hypothetical protein